MSAFPGYKQLVGPESLAPHTVGEKKIQTAADYKLWHRQAIANIYIYASVWESPESTPAQVNAGRWIAMCFWCKDGMSTSPEIPVAGCTSCGAWYLEGRVTFPETAGKIESILCMRPVKENQNWLLGETLDDLRIQNIEHETNREG
jgi:hypothetical protein